jgi:hypothetical protein
VVIGGLRGTNRLSMSPKVGLLMDGKDDEERKTE